MFKQFSDNEGCFFVLYHYIADDKNFKGVDAEDLLKEIKSDDPNINPLRKKFIETKELYSKTYYSPLIEIIKKSIKRTEAKIKKMNVTKIETGYRLYEEEEEAF